MILKKLFNILLTILLLQIFSLISFSSPLSAATATISIQEQSTNGVTFKIETTASFLGDPTITIYRGNSCTGNILAQEFIPIGGPGRQSVTYTWTSVLIGDDFSANVNLNTPPVVSNCVVGNVEVEPIPAPRPNAPPENCPTLSETQPANPGQGESIVFIFEPPTSGFNISDYSLDVIASSLSTDLTEENGMWIGELPSLPQGTHRVEISISDGTTCVIDNNFFVSQTPSGSGGLGSGENPCKDFDGDGDIECATAFGNIPTNITEFAGKVLSIALGIAGGIALILLVYGSIRVLTSSGNQQSLATGRDIIIAAIAGLLFLIFSVLILRALGLLIGVPFS